MSTIATGLAKIGRLIGELRPQRGLRGQTAVLGPENRSLPEADKWLLSEFIVRRLLPLVGVRPYPLDEQLLMCSSVAYFKPDLIVEWGTHTGCSARIFYETVQHLGLSSEIHSIDLPPDADHGENIHDARTRAHLVRDLDVHLHQGDGLMVAEQILAHRPAGFPLVFVDGDHAYKSVRRELDRLKEIAPRAAVLVHDSFFQGPESGYNCGPHEALAEFARSNGLPVYSTVLGLPGMSLTHWNDRERGVRGT